MDGTARISSSDLYSRLGTEAAPVVVDVRDAETSETLIIAATPLPASGTDSWRRRLGASRLVVAYGADEDEGRGAAAALVETGMQAAYLDGGIAAWKAQGLPTRRRRLTPDKWVTRERPKIDRIACPWLVSRFINPAAEFIYVPAGDVLDVAEKSGAVPYDIKGVEFGHVGDRCSFDAIVSAYDIHDPALDRLATIVRGADTSRPDLTPQGHGLLAISYGLSHNFSDDHEMLKHGMIIYDALYAWCRSQAPASAPKA